MNATEPNRCNGWSNRATWNVNLWVFNDEPMYRAWCDSASLLPFDADRAEWFVRYIGWRARTPDGYSLADVDWTEIADAWNQTRRDHDYA